MVLDDFNDHSVVWGYISTDENGTLVEKWSKYK